MGAICMEAKGYNYQKLQGGQGRIVHSSPTVSRARPVDLSEPDDGCNLTSRDQGTVPIVELEPSFPISMRMRKPRRIRVDFFMKG